MKKGLMSIAMLLMATVLSAQTAGTWYKFAETPTNYQNTCMATDPNGKMYFGAGYLTIGNTDYGGLASWDDSKWENVGDLRTSSVVYAIAFDSKGNLYACGDMSFVDAQGSLNFFNVGKWDGKIWTPIAKSVSPVPVAMVIDKLDNIFLGGAFSNVNGIANTAYFAKYDGTKWQSAGDVFLDAGITKMITDGTDIYAIGDFKKAGTKVLNNIARLNGGKWFSLEGGNTENKNYAFSAIALDANATLWVGGNFTKIGNQSISYLAKASGASWASVGTDPDGPVTSIAFDEKNIAYVVSENAGIKELYSYYLKSYKKITDAPTGIRDLKFDRKKFRLYTSGVFTAPSKNLTYYQFKTTAAKDILQEATSMVVSPNPANNQLTVDFKTALSVDTQLEIYDITGQFVSSQAVLSGHQTVALDVSSLTHGTYFVRVVDHSGLSVSKVFIKE